MPSQVELAPMVTRSFSMSSDMSSSSSSSTYSRSADDMLDRLCAQEPSCTFSLWSAGNIRLNGRDLTIPSRNAGELLEVVGVDERFEVISMTYLDREKEEWKVSIRRTDVTSSPTSMSDVE